MKPRISKDQFGPWALITGASSGIGREFARQIAASGINVVLVARREALLREVGTECSKDYGVEHQILALDLSREGFLKQLASVTCDLDIGLIISNAGTGSPGRFLSSNRDTMAELLRLNTLAHLDLAYHFGQRLVERRRGGFLFVGAMGADKGIPYMANDAGAKAYVQSLAEALHVEWKPFGMHVTVLPPGPTETPVLAKFGLTPDNMPMKPMNVEQCVREGLKALRDNRSLIIPGRMNRMMNALVPAPVVRGLMAKMFEKTLARRIDFTQ
jgi:short-subunit dehydrogenase